MTGRSDLPPERATRADELLHARPNAGQLAGMTTDAFQASGLDQNHGRAQHRRLTRNGRGSLSDRCISGSGRLRAWQPVVGLRVATACEKAVGEGCRTRLAC